MSRNELVSVGMVLTALLAGCGQDEDDKQPCSVADPAKGCSNGQMCEMVAGAPSCVAPLMVEGKVSAPGGQPIAAAIVTALDGNDAPTSGTALTGMDGRYQLRIPSARDAAGAPLKQQIKLRAAADGFDTFPSGLRRALPIEISGAASQSGKLVFASGATDLVLTPGATGLGSIAGTVKGEPGRRGVLVVAEGPSSAVSGISDADGAFVLFNVPPGVYTVRGYAAGVQLSPALVTISAGMRATGVDLSTSAAQLGSVSGSVSLVNAPGGSMTSVVLVVASTFNAALARGDVPPGLRAPKAGVPSVSGAFTIGDVPDGSYVVLAAFENDGLVRDPDTAIGGTQIQRVQVQAGAQMTLATGFKITEGLTVMQPGAGETPDLVMGTPTFVWKDDSSEDRYTLEVIDSRGTSVWKNEQIPRANGGNVSVTYAGPALTAGLYQFRVISLRKDSIPISATEDLRGVFLVP